MEILDGKIVSQSVKDELKAEVIQLIKNNKRLPHLAAILVGNNGASETYVASKAKNCEEIGFKSSLFRLNEDITESELINAVIKLNADESVEMTFV